MVGGLYILYDGAGGAMFVVREVRACELITSGRREDESTQVR